MSSHRARSSSEQTFHFVLSREIKKKVKKKKSGRSTPKCQQLLHCSARNLHQLIFPFFPLDGLSSVLPERHFPCTIRQPTSRRDGAAAKGNVKGPPARRGPSGGKPWEVLPAVRMWEERGENVFVFVFFWFGGVFLVLVFVFGFPPSLSDPLLRIFLARCTPLRSVSLCVYHCRPG